MALRRVRRGQMDTYTQLARLLAERWASPAGQISYQLCVDRDDPAMVMLLSIWPHRDRFESALGAIPTDLRDAVIAATEAVETAWQWFRPLRTIERIGEHAELAVATRFRVAPEHVDPLLEWSRRYLDAAIQIEGVVRIAYLRSIDDPTVFLSTVEYQNAAAEERAADVLAAAPPPVPLVDRRAFAGRIGYHWDRWEQARACSAG